MSFIARLQRAREILEQQGRLSIRALVLEIGDEQLDELIEELVDVQQVARREGKILVWAGAPVVHASTDTIERETRTSSATHRADNVLRPSAAGAADQDEVHSAEARKVVTIIFADLIGSTSLHERLDAESVRRLMDRYYRALHTAVEAHGGTVVKLMGDGVMAAFGVPRVAEDDAIRAVRAGVAMQHAFRELARNEFAAVGDIGLRVGINTGEVVVSAGNTDVVGDPVNVAARLQQEAHDGEVVIGESTRRLVAALVTLAPLGSFALKGRAEMMKAYRVESLDRPIGATTAAFVGRADELGRITAAYDAATAAPAARLAVVLGSPGLGKSRMMGEFARRLDDAATVLTAACDAAGGATFAPLAAALRELLSANRDQVPVLIKEGSGEVGQPARQPPSFDGAQDRPSSLLGKEGEGEQPSAGAQPVATGTARGTTPAGGGGAEEVRAALEGAVPGADAERARIIAGITALLAGSPASPEETFFVIRRFLAALAQHKPVVLVIDDLQWAEPLLLDLVEHLVQWGSGVPLLVLVGARPELRELRSSLVTTGGLVSDVVTLSGLDAGAAMRLAANVIGAADLPAAVAAKVLATSEGNPLFVGELVRMLVDEGAIERQGDRWIIGANLAVLEMPPTIHALLAARIERLRPDERTVLERAAVVGRHFSRSAVAALLGHDGSTLDARLEALRRTELIEPDTGWFLGEPVLRFHHVLIRDAAYRRLLKGTRAMLHAQLADWIEAKVGDAEEHDETVGWHLEQAHQHLRELGPIDDKGKGLGTRAALRLAAAGRRALGRDDVPRAANLLGRAIERVDLDDTTRADLALDWCEALLSAGDVGWAAQAIDELGRCIAANAGAPTPAPLVSAGEGNARLRAWHTCFTGQLTALTAPQQLQSTADAVAAAATELAKLGDAAGEAKAHSVHAQALARLGRVGACEAALDKALAAARRAGDRRRANAVLAGAPLAALWGPSPVTRASGRCLDVVRVLRITQGAPAVEAVALSCQGVLEALRGRTDAARRMIGSSRKMVEELGIAHRLFEADVFAGRIDLLEGDAAAAARTLRGAYDGLRDLGLGIDAARAGALLARAQLAQGNVAEAENLSRESEALAGDDLQAAIAWRGVRAEALARRGETKAAVELAQAAVAIASATDALLDHADARLALAATLRAAGRRAEAEAAERHAVELWDAKGATLLAGSARRNELAQSDARVGEAPAEPLFSAEGSAGALRQGSGQASRSHVRPNLATATIASVDAAFARRDLDAVVALASSKYEEVDQWTGATWNREEWIASCRRLMRSRDLEFHNEPLATLGEVLMLSRRRCSAAATKGAHFDVGAYESEAICFLETDECGLVLREEIFAADHLGDAIIRLYERYAELLPAGPERELAAAVAATRGRFPSLRDPDRIAAVVASDFEVIDHRRLSTWSARGAVAYLEHIRALHQVADRFDIGPCDVLALEPAAQLVRVMHHGTQRFGGGSYERAYLSLSATDATGRVSRMEFFDDDREADALTRFQELTSGALPLPLGEGAERPIAHRRVRTTAATVGMRRFEVAFNAGDLAAIAALYTDAVEVVDHPNEVTYGLEGTLKSLRFMLRSGNATARFELLATLGESLALSSHHFTVGGNRGRFFDVGEYEREEIALNELDESRRIRRNEILAPNRLRDAIIRLYERYAAQQPEGRVRERAAATARSVAAWNGLIDLERLAATMAQSVECVDHRQFHTWSARGAEEFLGHWREQLEIASGFAVRDDDVLGLTPNALLVRQTYHGNVRATGGAFENAVIVLFASDTAGLLARADVWEADCEAEALACFDELTAELPKPSLRRRVRLNAAAAVGRRYREAALARDMVTIEALTAPEIIVRHHPTAAVIDHAAALRRWHILMKAQGLAFREEPIATLGDSLTLSWDTMSFQRLAEDGLEFGASESKYVNLFEINNEGLAVRVEVFATDHLGDAIARLYERYAELMPEGRERERAAAVARSVAVGNGVIDPERLATVFTPSIECVDHRALHTWSSRGADEFLGHWREQIDLASGFAGRHDDILALTPDAFLARQTYSGSVRATGGTFENVILVLFAFGRDGLIARVEIWEPGCEVDALARFDELTRIAPLPLKQGGQEEFVDALVNQIPLSPSSKREAPAPGRRRRLRPNAASAAAARVEAALAAHDLDALDAVLGEVMESVDHANGIAHGREGHLDSTRRMMRLPGLVFRLEPLATLGDRLCLFRRLVAASGTAGGHFDVGAYEMEHVGILETEQGGRCRAFETFAADRLGDAVSRMCERYAEMLPDGPARRRAAAMAVRFDRTDLEDVAGGLDPDVEMIDHRLVGAGAVRGVPAVLAALRSLREVAVDLRRRTDDILALSDEAILRIVTNSGRLRESGGPFERHICVLHRYGADGHLTHWEVFDAERTAEALARFDELVGQRRESVVEPSAPTAPAQLFANAATNVMVEQERVWAARDWEARVASYLPTYELDDQRSLMRMKISGEAFFTQLRMLFDLPRSRFHFTPLATRGVCLALGRVVWEGDIDETGGPLVAEYLEVFEVDANGRCAASVLFDPDDLDAAYAELDRRYEAGEAVHARTTIAFNRALTSHDWEMVAALCAPTFVEHDRRQLAVIGMTRGADAWVQSLRTLIDLAPGTVARLEHVRVGARGFLNQLTWHGSREGGAYEIPLIGVAELDEQDKVVRVDIYDHEQFAQAQARFAELTAPSMTTAARFANAATHAVDRGTAALAARDWDGFARLFAPGARHIDRTRMAQLESDIREWLVSFRQIVEMTTAPPASALLATRDERLALFRMLWQGAGGDVGPSEIDWLLIVEVNERGEHAAIVVYDPDDLAAAYAELDARYAAEEAARHPQASAWVREFQRAFAARDWEAMAALHAPDQVAVNHRTVGWGMLRGPGAWVPTLQALVELAADTRFRLDHLRTCERGILWQSAWQGTRDGGPFETPLLVATELDDRGRQIRMDVWDAEVFEPARARFDEIGGALDPLRIPPNASTRANDRWWACAEAEDWDAVRALTAGMVFEDRRRLIRIAGGSELLLADTRHLWDSGWRPTRTLLATAGDRLSLERMLWSVEDGGQVSEIEVLKVAEVDAEGRIVAYIIFDADDRGAAIAELVERYARSDADETPAAWFEFVRAWNDHDLNRLRAVLPGEYFMHDHRRTGIGRMEGEAYIASLAALYELSPDVRLEPLYGVTRAAHGSVGVMRWVGTNAEGGEFEAVFAGLSLYRGERLIGAELFEIADLDAALARFEELRPATRSA